MFNTWLRCMSVRNEVNKTSVLPKPFVSFVEEKTGRIKGNALSFLGTFRAQDNDRFFYSSGK